MRETKRTSREKVERWGNYLTESPRMGKVSVECLRIGRSLVIPIGLFVRMIVSRGVFAKRFRYQVVRGLIGFAAPFLGFTTRFFFIVF